MGKLKCQTAIRSHKHTYIFPYIYIYIRSHKYHSMKLHSHHFKLNDYSSGLLLSQLRTIYWQIESHLKSLLHIEHFFYAIPHSLVFGHKMNIWLNNNLNLVVWMFAGTIDFACDFYWWWREFDKIIWKYNFNFFFYDLRKQFTVNFMKLKLWLNRYNNKEQSYKFCKF